MKHNSVTTVYDKNINKCGEHYANDTSIAFMVDRIKRLQMIQI